MKDLRSLELFALPIPAVLLGALIAYRSGIGLFAFAPNLLGVVLGILIYYLVWKEADFVSRNSFLLSSLGVFVISLTLLANGIESVHRWLPLGPMMINVSMILTPLVLNHVSGEGSLRSFVLVLMLSLILVFQPDAGQASAFAIAVGVICCTCHQASKVLRLVSIVLIAGLTWLAWERPDPLLPVTHVERIIHIARSQGLLMFFAAIASILLLFYPFLRRAFSNHGLASSTLPYTLMAYFIGCLL
jgi:cell division protein FtsW (lipid II flippase)